MDTVLVVAAPLATQWATLALAAVALSLAVAIAAGLVLLHELRPSLFRPLTARFRSAPAPETSAAGSGAAATDLDAWRRELEDMRLEDLERYRAETIARSRAPAI
jgi:hypothetical protein